MKVSEILKRYALFDLTYDDLACLCLGAQEAIELISGDYLRERLQVPYPLQEKLICALPSHYELRRLNLLSKKELLSCASTKTEDEAMMLIWLYTLERRYRFPYRPVFLKDASEKTRMLAESVAQALTYAFNQEPQPLRSQEILQKLGKLCLDERLCPSLQSLTCENEEALPSALKALKIRKSLQQCKARNALSEVALGFYAGIMRSAVTVERGPQTEPLGILRCKLYNINIVPRSNAARFKRQVHECCLKHGYVDPFLKAVPKVLIPDDCSCSERRIFSRLRALQTQALLLDSLKKERATAYLEELDETDALLVSALCFVRTFAQADKDDLPSSTNADDRRVFAKGSDKVRQILLSLREDLRALRAQGHYDEYVAVQQALRQGVLIAPDFGRLRHRIDRQQNFKQIVARLRSLGITDGNAPWHDSH